MTAKSDYSIVWLEREICPCVRCGSEVGYGPVGWHSGNPIGPICDSCMIGAERGLGAVLMAVNVLRELAGTEIGAQDDHDRVVIAIMTFMRLYERAEDWPVRSFGFLNQLEHIAARMQGETGRAFMLDLIQPGPGEIC